MRETLKRWLSYFKSSMTKELPEDAMKVGEEYPKFRKMLSYFFPLFKKYWILAIVCAVLPSLSMLINLPMPMISRYFIDNVLLKKNMSLLIPVLAVMISMRLVNRVFSSILQFLNIRFDRGLTIDMNKMILTKLTALPKSFFDKNRTGYIMSRTGDNVSVVKWFFGGVYTTYFNMIVSFCVGVSFLFYLEWRLAILIVASIPLSFIGTRFFVKKTYILNHYNSEISSKTAAATYEIYSSMPLVKAFSTEKQTVEKLLDLIRLRFKLSNEMMAFGMVDRFFKSLVPTVIRSTVFLLGAYWIIKGQWELGSLYAFQSYMGRVASLPDQIINGIKRFQSTKVSLERMSVLFEALPEANVDTGVEVEKLKGKIELKDVSFYYERNKPVLKNVSLQINPGEHWAIIGPSGIGKSTLVSLIMRFYIPQHGIISYDNEPSSYYNVRALRRRIGYVSQSTELLAASVIDNIKYGNSDAKVEDVIKAAKAARIHEFIEELPDKYETLLNEHAVNLSEGQKQRLSIARALVRNPDILIFDEPTSALDNITERSIYEALPEYIKNRTTLTIAHRLSTVQNADKIILLGKGCQYFIGTHETLIEDNELYQEFFENIKD